MSLSNANIIDRIEEYLQDSTNTDYTTTEIRDAMEEELKLCAPLMVDVVFQIESRYGTDNAGTASALTDTTKGQFVSADPTNEKVVHNTTDDTWAVVTGYTSANVLTLSRNIMASGENYEIYNKRCRNKRQVYIGDMPTLYHQKVARVEYPVGVTERAFRVYDGGVLELSINDEAVRDSDSTLTTLEEVDVLVTFAVPPLLSQLTDWAGELTADAAAGATAVAVDGLSGTETVKEGEQFYLENHRSLYIVTADLTLTAGAGTLSIYPPLEAAAANNDDITFRKSTLSPNQETLLIRRGAARALLSEKIRKSNTINTGGGSVSQSLRQSAIDLLAETQKEWRGKPRPYRTLSRYW